MDKFLYYFIRNSYTMIYNSFNLHSRVLLNSLDVLSQNETIKNIFDSKKNDLLEEIKKLREVNKNIKTKDLLDIISLINKSSEEVRDFYARNYDYSSNLFQKHRLRRIVHNDTTLRKTSQKNILFFSDIAKAYMKLFDNSENDIKFITYFNNDKAIKYKEYKDKGLIYLTNPSFSEQFSLLSVSMIGHEIYHIAKEKKDSSKIKNLLELIESMMKRLKLFCIYPIINEYGFDAIFNIDEEIEADFFAYISTGPAYLLSLFIVFLKQYLFYGYNESDEEQKNISFLLIRFQTLRLLVLISMIENIFINNKYIDKYDILDEIKEFLIVMFHNLNEHEFEYNERVNMVTSIDNSVKMFSGELKNYFEKNILHSNKEETELKKFIFNDKETIDNIFSFTEPILSKINDFNEIYEKNPILWTPSFILYNIIHDYEQNKIKDEDKDKDRKINWSAGRVIRKMRLWQYKSHIVKEDKVDEKSKEYKFKFNFYEKNINFKEFFEEKKCQHENNNSNKNNEANNENTLEKKFINFIKEQKWQPKLFVFKNKLINYKNEKENNKSFLSFLFVDLLKEYGDVKIEEKNNKQNNDDFIIIGDYNNIIDIEHSSKQYLMSPPDFETEFINKIIDDNKENKNNKNNQNNNEISKLYILLKIKEFNNKIKEQKETIGNIFNNCFSEQEYKKEIKYIKIYKCMGNEDLLYEFGINNCYFSVIKRILNIFRSKIEDVDYTKTYLKINNKVFEKNQEYNDLILRIKVVIDKNKKNKPLKDIVEDIEKLENTQDISYITGDYDIEIDLIENNIRYVKEMYKILKEYSIYINTKLIIKENYEGKE